MKTILIFPLLFLVLNFAHAQYWMQRGGGLTIDEGMDIASDGANNIYTTGYFTTSATFDGSIINSAGLDDIFIAKTNTAGNLQWLKRAGGLNIDKALSIDADNSGNILITGFFYTTADFDGQIITSAGQQDIFIAKYNSSGTLQWVKRAGGTGSDAGNGVTFDNSGNVIVTGEFSGSCSFGSTTLTSQAGSIDVFTAKYDNNGNFLWAKKGSGTYTDRGTDVSTDASGNIYVSGMFSDTITFDVQHNNPMYNAMFLIKYNGSGAEQWFRWMGSGTVVNMGGVAVHNSDVNITGNFNGTLYFFGGVTNPTLSSSYQNDIFVCRFDLSGNLVWSHADGSTASVTAEAIGTKTNGEVIIGGNFRCRFSSFSVQYGNGIFCSIGYLDTYVASYDNSGNWMWARHYGGQQNDYLFGLTVLPNNSIANTGSYISRFFSTFEPGSFTPHGINGMDYSYVPLGNLTYCSDNNYTDFVYFYSYGNSDIFINANIDINREPYDYFQRTGTSCVRPFNDVCIGNSLPNLSCQDTISICGSSTLGVDFNTLYDLDPDFNYLWNTGSTVSSINVSTSGYYNVKVTTVDGCFTNRDTIYFLSHPNPAKPLITDSKGININASVTQPIPLCLPDSVTLTCPNVGTNTVQWDNFPIGQNPVTVNTGGYHYCTLTNQFGCVNSNYVEVIVGNALPAVQPRMRCLEDTDNNDTIELCFGEHFTMYLYDQLSNPGGTIINCFPGMSKAKWTSGAILSYGTPSYCSPSTNYFTPAQVGTFFVIINAWIIRSNPCDTDSVFCNKSLHVIVHPTPTGSLSIAVNGPSYICFGDSAMLIATPDTNNYHWSTGQTNDTIYVTQPGTYSVSTSLVVTNSFGCSATLNGYGSIIVSFYPQPNVTMIPANGLICPNDSVKLICSGTGIFQWQGPNGSIGTNLNTVYVNTPGFYYCIQTVAPGCDLVSNTVQVTQYNIPLIIAFPSPAFCTNTTVTLTVITNPGSVIQWLPPLSGSGISQTVTLPGTYHCNVTSCGILTPLSFTVYQDSAVAQIQAANTSLSFCSGDSLLLSANTGMSGYLWLPSGDSALNFYASQGGNYSLITTSTHGCKDTASITITEIPNTLTAPEVSDTVICAGDSVLIIAVSNDPVHWSASPAYSNIFYTGYAFQTSSLIQPVTYYLFTESGVCRSDFDSVVISIDEHCNTIFIPNVFTPNGDGMNDFFPGFPGHYKLDIEIYNRWGNVIYKGSQTLTGWDGYATNGEWAPDGTYYYVLAAHFYDGSDFRQKGFLTLIKD
ncbi:MAG TPA: gliding motility-associated C-terminal domain-containing protein [Bacteroidia bacterium]|nr:gliding motility-associated C-terminal domain-containing protein [Bacteroidia bacterium]